MSRPKVSAVSPRPANFVGSDFFQQLTHGVWPHRDNQQVSRFYGPMQIRFDGYAVLPLELLQLSSMPVMHNDGLIVPRQPQPRQQRAGDTAATEKDGGFHESPEQAWSAASTSVCTSASVCAVEIIQCRPFEGVI